MRRSIFTAIIFFLFSSVYALPFNQQLSETDIQKLNAGECIIRNIDYAKNMSLSLGAAPLADQLIEMVNGFSPKYLGEVILVKPYKGNEDLPERITTLLNNIESYTDINYYSEHAQKWFMLYDEATILSTIKTGKKTIMQAHLVMKPFGDVDEQIEMISDKDSMFYSASNKNSLSFKNIKNLLGPEKLKIGIVVFKHEDNWIIYGVGGANALHIPFLTDRIRVSLINRICSFCDYIFKKL